MMSRDCSLLVVFLKYPTPGRVKTRLAARVGEDRASQAYRELVAETLRAVGEWVALGRGGRRVWLYFDPAGQDDDVRRWLTPALGGWCDSVEFVAQPAADLGGRLEWVFGEAATAGYSRVAAVGSDCPYLTGEALARAFAALDAADVVLGPASDGGYYLIGLTAPQPRLFRNIPWSSVATLASTQAAAADAGLTVASLPPLPDVDTADDWEAWVHRDRL